jgi:chromosome segregation ATPase
MKDPAIAQASVIMLAELTQEIEDLELSRQAILQRLDSLRTLLLNAGNQTTKLRASVDLLSEHMTDLAFAEVIKLENEIRKIGLGLTNADKETSLLLFEGESLEETLADTEDDLERFSQYIIEGKPKLTRGH